MAAAKPGIYGNSKDEALHFAPGQLPPVNAFWSLTMYELPSSMLVANPLNRYLINSAIETHRQPAGDDSQLSFSKASELVGDGAHNPQR